MRPVPLLVAITATALLSGVSPLLAPAAHAPAGTASAAEDILRQDPESPEDPDMGDDEDPGEEPEPEPEPEPGTAPPPMKPPPTVPDSLRKIPAAALPVGGAPVETLVVRPGNVLGRPDASAAKAPPPKPRGTPFGLHPAAIFAVLLVGHIFLVRAVTD